MRSEGELTRAQRRCLRAVLIHDTVKETARCLGISDQTVKNHLRETYRRLGVRNRTGAARELGWLKVPGSTASEK